MRVADQIVEFISRFISPKVFLLTGNGAMYINDAMQIHEKIEYVCVRNEAVAPVAASAYSQATGKIGTVCVTAGPGAANAMPGVVEAWVDGVPIFVISGQVPSIEVNDFEKDLRTFGIAGIPVIDYVKPFTKFATSLMNVNELEDILEKILISFRSGRPGPVWLDVPLDIQSSESPIIDFNAMLKRVDSNIDSAYSLNDEKLLSNELLDEIRKSKHPLVILGTGAFDKLEHKAIIDWLVSTNIPFALTRPVVHKIPLDQRNNLGVLGVRGRPWSKEVFDKVDLIIGIGTRLPTSLVGSNYSYLNPEVKIILINSESAEIEKHRKMILNTNPISANKFIENCQTFRAFEDNKDIENWSNEVNKIKLKYPIVFKTLKNDPLNLYWFCSNLESYLTSLNIVTTDAGSNYYATGQAMKFTNGQREITSGTFAAMGISVPLAIGASVALENKSRTICITGDGSIELNVQELQTISNYNMNIAIFVINNGGYASMRAWQDTFFESRYIGSTDETGTRPMNFSKIAEAFNLHYESISHEEDFHNKINEIIESTRPTLIEVMCDPNQFLDLPMNSDVV
jgi:acetolactate synthase I/II/III large subunit